jgi:nitrite reductase/ring-hydroxylating ferredoxin subunit
VADLNVNPAREVRSEVTGLSRREAIALGVSALFALPWAVGGMGAIAKFAGVPKMSFTGATVPDWVPAGLVADLTAEPKEIAFGEDTVYVVGQGSGAVALSGICPHAGCLVAYDAEKGEFICPCHEAVFAKDGSKVSGPQPSGLFRHKVKISMGRVLVGRRDDG